MSAEKMRDYVDGVQGAGSWDRMHDLIDQKQLFGWTMPSLEVDGCKVDIFPGTDREVTVEAIQGEIRRLIALHPHEQRGTSH